MNCPKCKAALPNNLEVETVPLKFVFQMGVGPDNLLRRITDLVAIEVSGFDYTVPNTHFTVCKSCGERIDVSTIEIPPRCVVCKKEKPKMTPTDNNCFYAGLICIDCQKKRWHDTCETCGKLSRCKLGKRANPDNDRS